MGFAADLVKRLRPAAGGSAGSFVLCRVSHSIKKIKSGADTWLMDEPK